MMTRTLNAIYLLACVLMAIGLTMDAPKVDKGLSIRLNPRALQVGQSTWLTCRVTPDSRNRKLHFGLAGSEREDSQRDLQGYDAPITWGPMEFKHIPCNAGPAYCIVEQQGERPLQAMETLIVGGCDGPTQ